MFSCPAVCHDILDLRERLPTDELWLTVEKICSLYERTRDGLRAPYRIYLFEKTVSGETAAAYGFVRHEKLQPGQQHPLAVYFRTAVPDENGHIPWPQWLMTRDIHLRLDGLNFADDGKVACLLLHEATHKWANTTDVCYKYQTIAQKLKHNEWNKAEDQRKSDKAKALARQIQVGAQRQLIRPDKAKPLLPMAKEGVSAEDLVYNADSYACMARRLWKEETDKGARDYPGWED